MAESGHLQTFATQQRRTLSTPFDAVASATLDANKVGLTTDDFLKIVDKLAEFAKVTSTMPPLASTATLRGTSESIALLAALREALSGLVKLIGF
jgi:hypothetical protein